MTRCICYKSDGSQCSRDTSTKAGQNSLYCWQHQNCAKSTQSTGIKFPQSTEHKDPGFIDFPNKGIKPVKKTKAEILKEEKFYKDFYAGVKKEEKENKIKNELIYEEWKKNDDKLPIAVEVYTPPSGYVNDHKLYPHPQDKQLKNLFKSLVGSYASVAATTISQFEPKFTIIKDYGKSGCMDLCMIRPNLVTIHVGLDDTIKYIVQG